MGKKKTPETKANEAIRKDCAKLEALCDTSWLGDCDRKCGAALKIIDRMLRNLMVLHHDNPQTAGEEKGG